MFSRLKVQKIFFRSISAKKTRGEFKMPEGNNLLEPWCERIQTKKSIFELLQPKTAFFGPDYLRIVQTPINLNPSVVAKWYKRKMEEQEIAGQAFLQERYDILGPDLSAAHFLVHRGASIRFYNDKKWIKKLENDENVPLPPQFLPGLFIEAIDCQNFHLRPNGVENILDLPKLKWLSLNGNPFLTDWCLDSISGSYGDTLQYLDISNCPKITHRGLACFYRFDNLNTLIVNGTANDCDEFRLSCLMLEDLKPKLSIKGVNHSKIT